MSDEDRRTTSPAMQAVDPWARLDRVEASVAAHAERCAERFGEAKAKADGVAERCVEDNAASSRRIDAAALVARGLEARVVAIETWKPMIEAAVKHATDRADLANTAADANVKEMRDTAAGLSRILADAEKAMNDREAEKKHERDEAARVARQEREAAQALHAARFEAQGNAIQRQAAGIVTVGEAVTGLYAVVGTLQKSVNESVDGARHSARRFFLALAVLVVVGSGVIVATVLWSNTETVQSGVAK